MVSFFLIFHFFSLYFYREKNRVEFTTKTTIFCTNCVLQVLFFIYYSVSFKIVHKDCRGRVSLAPPLYKPLNTSIFVKRRARITWCTVGLSTLPLFSILSKLQFISSTGLTLKEIACCTGQIQNVWGSTP